MPDYVAEAAVLSKKVGRPVKVVWSREDDIKFDYYHTVSAMYMKAALDANGKPAAWLQRSVFPPIASIYNVGERYGEADDLGQGWTDIPYDIPNLRVENGPAKAYVRIGWLRSVANIYHAFAVQSFSDELAHAAGRDPLEYLLELIGAPRIVDLKGTAYSNYDASYSTYPIDTGRLRRVVQLAAEKAGWSKRKMGKGSGMGIAVHRSFVTYVATVVEVEVDDHGKVKIRMCIPRSMRGSSPIQNSPAPSSRAPRCSAPVWRAPARLPRPTARSINRIFTITQSPACRRPRSARMSTWSIATLRQGA
jgi:isoquinoline 1-oxidoreductase beta subunit